MKIKLALYCLILITFCSCNDKVNVSSPAFIGYWYGINNGMRYSLNIDLESHATYEISWPDSNYQSIEGLARANSRKLTINHKQYFEIVEYPHKVDTSVEKFYIPAPDGTLFIADYKMILDGMHHPSKDIPGGEFTYYK
jgi:hypothetical protein